MLSIEYFQSLVERYGDVLSCKVQEFSIGNEQLSFDRKTYLMGVVNLSPDSWYRESVCLSKEQAVQRGRRLAVEGATIVDIGAESSLSQAELVSGNKQTSRFLPVIKELAKEGIVVSAETYHPDVARACLDAGALVLNLTGLQESDKIFRIAAEHDAAIILCYVEGKNVREVGDFNIEGDVIGRMYDYFGKCIDEAEKAGIRKIMIDPGLGFYYRNLQDSTLRIRHQMKIFLETFRLRKLGWPLCHALPHAFEFFGEEVRTAESFFAVLAILGKTNLLRTHEVAKVKSVLMTMESWTEATA